MFNAATKLTHRLNAIAKNNSIVKSPSRNLDALAALGFYADGEIWLRTTRNRTTAIRNFRIGDGSLKSQPLLGSMSAETALLCPPHNQRVEFSAVPELLLIAVLGLQIRHAHSSSMIPPSQSAAVYR